MKKRTLATVLMLVTLAAGIGAASFTFGVETKSNGFALSTYEEPITEKTVLNMDLGLDMSLGIYSDKGLGGYISGGYNMQSEGIGDISVLHHGVSADLGFAFKKAMGKTVDFMISTGLGMDYNISKELIQLDYNVGLDFLFNISRSAYVKLGAGYQLEFFEASNLDASEPTTKTYVKNRVLVPTVGFGFKF